MRVNGIQLRFSLSSGEAEYSRDQAELPGDFRLADPSCLSLPNHVQRLITGDRPQRAPKRSGSLDWLFTRPFNGSMLRKGQVKWVGKGEVERQLCLIAALFSLTR
jgi:hypothetical protein